MGPLSGPVRRYRALTADHSKEHDVNRHVDTQRPGRFPGRPEWFRHLGGPVEEFLNSAQFLLTGYWLALAVLGGLVLRSCAAHRLMGVAQAWWMFAAWAIVSVGLACRLAPRGRV